MLAVEVLTERKDLINMFLRLQDKSTIKAVEAERLLAKVLGGGCKLPIGCYVHFEKKIVSIHGMVGSMDSMHCVTKTLRGAAIDTDKLIRQLAAELAKEPFVANYVKIR